jgi:hypothetical protein
MVRWMARCHFTIPAVTTARICICEHKEPLIMPNMNRVAAKFAMDARSDPRRIAVAYSQGERQRRRANLAQPLGALTLRVDGCVARFAKGGATATRYRVAAACGSSRQLAPHAPEGYAPPCWGCTIRYTSRLAVPSRHVTAQQPIAGARAGRPSRTKCYAPPCPACNPARPSARPCGT